MRGDEAERARLWALRRSNRPTLRPQCKHRVIDMKTSNEERAEPIQADRVRRPFPPKLSARSGVIREHSRTAVLSSICARGGSSTHRRMSLRGGPLQRSR